jgi:hypothetical protein
VTLTLSQMQTLIYRYGFDASDPVVSVLNGSMHEIESMFDWSFLEEDLTSFVMSAGNNLVSLPSDFAKVIVLRDTDHLTKLKYYRLSKFKRQGLNEASLGTPVIYTIVGKNIVQVYPTPVTNVNMELVYQGLTPDLVNPTDVPTTGTTAWPAYMHFPIVWRAAAVMLQMENEEERAKTAQEQFERAILTCMGRDGERELDEVETVEDEQGYMTGDYAAPFRRN